MPNIYNEVRFKGNKTDHLLANFQRDDFRPPTRPHGPGSGNAVSSFHKPGKIAVLEPNTTAESFHESDMIVTTPKRNLMAPKILSEAFRKTNRDFPEAEQAGLVCALLNPQSLNMHGVAVLSFIELKHPSYPKGFPYLLVEYNMDEFDHDSMDDMNFCTIHQREQQEAWVFLVIGGY